MISLHYPTFLRPPNHRLQLHHCSLRSSPPSMASPQPPHISIPSSSSLKIAIIGFGNFGQFLARTLIRHGHTILAHSRSNYSQIAKSLGVFFFENPHDICEEHPDIVLLSTSILSSEQILLSLPLHRLKRSTMFADVLSVKEFPRDLFLRHLPSDFDILCTHPMFGPQSGKNSWEGLTFVFDKVRVGKEESREHRCDRFLQIFAAEGCKMVEMECSEHDRYAAGSQFITHTVGRVLQKMGLEKKPVCSLGYDSLLNLVDNTAGDSFELYYGLFMYNKNAMEQLERLDSAFESVRKLLFGNLHNSLRKQLFGVPFVHENIPMENQKEDMGSPSFLSSSSNNSSPNGQNMESKYLKTAIIGFGKFGQFIAKTFVHQGHEVVAYSRSNYSDVAQHIGVRFFSEVDDLCEEHPEVVIICTSMTSTEKVLKSIPFQRLKRNTLFADVLSLKEFPKRLFLQALPPNFDIICTHPIFGPESAKNGWNGLPVVFEKVRIGAGDLRLAKCDRFLRIFEDAGCKMVEMSCADHDLHTAGTQFITHTVGRVLEKLGLTSTPINTKGYEMLLNLVDNTTGDSFDLYYGLFVYNKNAMKQLEMLGLAFESLKNQLFAQLHDILQRQLIVKSNAHISDKRDHFNRI